jgi:hypothetical protein
MQIQLPPHILLDTWPLQVVVVVAEQVVAEQVAY